MKAIPKPNLKKIVVPAASSSRNGTHRGVDRREDVEFRNEVFTNVHDRCDVAAAVAVVWRTPYGNYRLVFEVPFESFIDQLVCTSNTLNAINVIELGCYLVTKEPTSPARTYSPSAYLLWVTPD